MVHYGIREIQNRDFEYGIYSLISIIYSEYYIKYRLHVIRNTCICIPLIIIAFKSVCIQDLSMKMWLESNENMKTDFKVLTRWLDWSRGVYIETYYRVCSPSPIFLQDWSVYLWSTGVCVWHVDVVHMNKTSSAYDISTDVMRASMVIYHISYHNPEEHTVHINSHTHKENL